MKRPICWPRCGAKNDIKTTTAKGRGKHGLMIIIQFKRKYYYLRGIFVLLINKIPGISSYLQHFL